MGDIAEIPLGRGRAGAGVSGGRDGCAGQEAAAHAAGNAALRDGPAGASHLIHQPAGERAGDEVRRQILAGAGKIAGRRPEAGGHQGHVLAPVHVGILRFVDGVVAGGPSKEKIVGPGVAVLQSAGLDNAEPCHSQRQEQQLHQMLLHVQYLPLFLLWLVQISAAARTAMPPMQIIRAVELTTEPPSETAFAASFWAGVSSSPPKMAV